MELWNSLRFAVRSLIRDKGFALTTILTLAVSIGAGSAMFAIVNSVLLRPLPFTDSERILLVYNNYPKAGVGVMYNSAAGDYYDRLEGMKAFEEQAMYNLTNQTIEINNAPEQVRGMRATPSLFRLLKTGAAVGRTFTNDEGEEGADQKVILSYALWQQLYGGDKNKIGGDMRINGRTFTIVGVMPKTFQFMDPDVRYWIPLSFSKGEKKTRHNNNWYNVGRLKPGATLAQAQTQVDAINAANMDLDPGLRPVLINAGFHSKVETLQNVIVRDVKSGLFLLWGGAMCLVLIGAVNLLSITLARLNTRRKEMATRLALGAGRGRIAWQLVTEHSLLGIVGGAAGIGLTFALMRLVASLAIDRLPRAGEIHIDAAVVAFGFVLALLVAVTTGLAPLGAIFDKQLGDGLREDSRTGTRGRASRIARQCLVVTQVACAFVLLVGAGLLLTSFSQLLRVDPGFNSKGVLTAAFSAPSSTYKTGKDVILLADRSLAAMRSIPGVQAAGATSSIPLGGEHSDGVLIAEGHVMKPGESVISPSQMTITPGYLEAMGINLIKGRALDDHDTETSKPVLVVDDKLAAKFWPGQDPIGRRAYVPQSAEKLLVTDEKTVWLTVVGVVRSIRQQDLSGDRNTAGAYYFPFKQNRTNSLVLAVKTSGDAASLASAVRERMKEIDPALALFEVRTMEQRAELSLAPRKASVFLAAGFGVVALFLASLGIYGVLAYLVTQRRREIGIRIALGSTQGGVARLVLSEGMLLATAGLVMGIAGSVALRTLIESQVYGVSPLDPAVLLGVSALLGAVALLACLAPVQRAMRVDPVRVLND